MATVTRTWPHGAARLARGSCRRYSQPVANRAPIEEAQARPLSGSCCLRSTSLNGPRTYAPSAPHLNNEGLPGSRKAILP